MGSPTVLINGLMAARMGDQTTHGGVIVGGGGTVLIGTGSAGAGSGDLGAAGSGPVTPQVCLVKAAKAGTPFVRQAR
jgi:hypothetical protein